MFNRFSFLLKTFLFINISMSLNICFSTKEIELIICMGWDAYRVNQIYMIKAIYNKYYGDRFISIYRCQCYKFSGELFQFINNFISIIFLILIKYLFHLKKQDYTYRIQNNILFRYLRFYFTFIGLVKRFRKTMWRVSKQKFVTRKTWKGMSYQILDLVWHLAASFPDFKTEGVGKKKSLPLRLWGVLCKLNLLEAANFCIFLLTSAFFVSFYSGVFLLVNKHT